MLSTIVVPPEISAALAAVIAAVLTGIAAWIQTAGQSSKKAATIEDVIARLDDIDAGLKALDDRERANNDLLLRLIDRRR
jgi:hypothetical protein